jgi:DNA polymerase (family 10)
MENTEIADVFDEIADLIDLEGGNAFRIRSYRAAARTIRDSSRRIEEIAEAEDLTDLPNIGEGMAQKIHEILETGTCGRLEELRSRVPEELTELLKIPQVGPRTAMQIHRELGVDTLTDLEKACREGRVRSVEGLGEKTEQSILEGIEMLKQTTNRFLIRPATEHLEALGRHLDQIKTIDRWEVAGSYRRRKETIGDLDILVMAGNRSEATKGLLSYPDIGDVLGRGEEKISVRLRGGLQVDFRFFEEENFGSALIYFTGSKAHNIAIRRRAQQNGWKLNEYGLFKDDHLLAGKTEEAVYHRLAMSWIPPELREDRGEVEAAESGKLPRLVVETDIRGDLQSHTEASDGENTIAEMAKAAIERGYQYLALTDHSKKVTMAGGLDDDEVRRHAEAIRQVDQELGDFWLLAGIEVDILKSGKLDLREKTLEDLDWVVASIHYNMNLDRKSNTDRLVRAISSGVVHCIGHPLGRIIGRREPMEFDLDRVFEACVENRVLLEINAQPERLDLPDRLCRSAMEAGVEFTISTDAHRTPELDLMPFGVHTARRGWIEKKHVLNTRTVEQLRKRLQHTVQEAQ